MHWKTLKDVVEWDRVNWSRAIRYWQSEKILLQGARVLDIGARNGGLSLFFALEGGEVVCSDLKDPTVSARQLHEKYGVADRIRYEKINATDIPFHNEFDIVCFKSVLGGIGAVYGTQGQARAFLQMYNALKPGGYLLFAENLKASPIHMFFRKRFVEWGNRWHYDTLEEISRMLVGYEIKGLKALGFFGAFGRSQIQRTVLGCIDVAIDRLFSESVRYIGVFIAQKPPDA